jgi:hypothetical protein
MLFDRPAWIDFAGVVLLALITLFSSYNHVFIPGFATSLLSAAGEFNLAFNTRYESAELRARAKYFSSLNQAQND